MHHPLFSIALDSMLDARNSVLVVKNAIRGLEFRGVHIIRTRNLTCHANSQAIALFCAKYSVAYANWYFPKTPLPEVY